MKKILIASLTALVLLAPGVNAQDNLDEELVTKLIRLHQSKPARKVNNTQVQNKISQLRVKLRQLDPATPKNRAALAEYSTTSQGQEECRLRCGKALIRF